MATEDKAYRKRIDPTKDPKMDLNTERNYINRSRRKKSEYVGKKPNMTRQEADKKYAPTGQRTKNPNFRKRKILKSRLDEQRHELNRRRNMLINSRGNPKKIVEPSDSMKVDTTTSAYGDAGRGRPVPKFIDKVIPKKPKARKNDRRLPPKEDNYGQFSKGGEVCRGAGAAIKGTNFKGVF